MNEQQPKTKHCYRCGNFEGYYVKGVSRFDRATCGFCKHKREIVQNTGGCECWKNSYGKRSVSKKASLKVLSSLLADITAIRQILTEAQEEDL